MPSLRIQRVAKSAALVPGYLRSARKGLVVLLYHRVGEGDRSIDLPAEDFERQLRYLKYSAEVVGLDEGLDRAADPSMDETLVAVTFDDGTADFHDHALPLLKSYGVPATLYLSTGPVEERIPFPSWGGDGIIDAEALTWSQVDECVASGLVTIASHTHTHADLDRLEPAAVDQELRRSRSLIEDRLGRACPHFAYPHAVTSPASEAAVKGVYDTAAVGGWRTNKAGAIDPYRITRVPITRADTDRFFRAKIQGRMAAEALLYRVGGTRR